MIALAVCGAASLVLLLVFGTMIFRAYWMAKSDEAARNATITASAAAGAAAATAA